MDRNSGYLTCSICGKGHMLPVTLGSGEDRDVTYRCTNPDCGIRFDKHGYERYDEQKQDWVRITE